MAAISSATQCRCCGQRQCLAFTAAEVGEVLGLSERHVRTLVDSGDIPRLDFIGSSLRVPAVWLEARCAEATEAVA